MGKAFIAGNQYDIRKHRLKYKPDTPFGDADWLKKPLLVQGDDDEIREERSRKDLRQKR